MDLGNLGTFNAASAASGQAGLRFSPRIGLGGMFPSSIRQDADGSVGLGKLHEAVTPKTYEAILEERRAALAKKKLRHDELRANFAAAKTVLDEFIKANDIKITYRGLKAILGLWHVPYSRTYTPVVIVRSNGDQHILTIEDIARDSANFCHNSGYDNDNTTEGIVQSAKAYLARNQDL